MILYDVRCQRCGHDAQVWKRMDEPVPPCDEPSVVPGKAKGRRKDYVVRCGGERKILLSATPGWVYGGKGVGPLGGIE